MNEYKAGTSRVDYKQLALIEFITNYYQSIQVIGLHDVPLVLSLIFQSFRVKLSVPF